MGAELTGLGAVTGNESTISASAVATNGATSKQMLT